MKDSPAENRIISARHNDQLPVPTKKPALSDGFQYLFIKKD